MDFGNNFKCYKLFILIEKSRTRESVVCNNTFKLASPKGFDVSKALPSFRLETRNIGPSSGLPIRLCILSRYPGNSHVHSSLRSHVVSYFVSEKKKSPLIHLIIHQFINPPTLYINNYSMTAALL